MTLRHYDPSQLPFQIAETVNQRVYLRHGVAIGPGATVLDVGANVGVAAAFFAAEGAAAVHSFEPVRPLYELLRENIAELPGCTAHPYGLGAAPERARITYYRGASPMSGLHADPERDREFVRRRILALGLEPRDRELDERFVPEVLDCELRPLRDVLPELSLRRVDLLKIDVERAELDVLRGLDDEGWEAIAQLSCEVHDEDGRLATVVGELERRGFRVAADQDEVMRGTEVHMVYATR